MSAEAISILLYGLDVLYVKFVGWIVRRKTSLRNVIDAKCYASAIVLVSVPLQVLINLFYVLLATLGVSINLQLAGLIELTIGYILGLGLSLYMIGAVAAFNSIRFRRFFLGYTIPAFLLGILIGAIGFLYLLKNGTMIGSGAAS